MSSYSNQCIAALKDLNMNIRLFAFMCVLIVMQPALAQPLFTQLEQINHFDDLPGVDPYHHRFGQTVVAQDGYLAVKSDQGANTHGAVGPIYVYNSTTRDLLYSINPASYPSSPYMGDFLDIHNARLIAAVYPNWPTEGPYMIHVIDLASGNESAAFEFSNAQGEEYGADSLLLRGDLAYVGTARDDTAGENSGAIHIYNIDTGKLVMSITNPIASTNSGFGTSIDISGDILIAGDSSGYGGDCHAIDLQTGELLWTYGYEGGNYSTDFGERVTIGDSIVAVTAPGRSQVLLLDLMTGELRHTIQLNDYPGVRGFNTEVDIDQGTLIVGAEYSRFDGDSSRGVAFFYNVHTAQQIAILSAQGGRESDHFGSDVALENGIGYVGAMYDNVDIFAQAGSVNRYEVPDTRCYADINHDGLIDLGDVIMMINSRTDLDLNGHFNYFDISLLIHATQTNCQQ